LILNNRQTNEQRYEQLQKLDDSLVTYPKKQVYNPFKEDFEDIEDPLPQKHHETDSDSDHKYS
jgi:hypothetical protein